ncbi:tyrosine-type recombinase/integrase [Geodermatophilus sp. SYSU D01180]
MTRKGSVRQRHARTCKPGHAKCHGPWYWMVDLGPDPGTGQRRRKTKSGYGKKAEAEAALAEFLDRQGVTRGRSEDLTVAAWLDLWLRSLRTKSPTTVARYRQLVDLHLQPILGHHLLVDLTPEDVDDLIDRISKPDYVAAGRRGNRWKHQKGLSTASINRIFFALRGSLSVAAKRRLIPWNPALHVDVVPEVNVEGKAWSPQEAAAFLAFTSEHRLYAVWHLLLMSGARRGELCGVRWTDLDLDKRRWKITTTRVQVGGVIHEKKPKSKAGDREVHLDEQTVDVLRAHRRRQQEERLALGPPWQDSGFVFTSQDGSPLTPEYLSRTWRGLVEDSGLPRIRLHDGRHTANSTAALYAGVTETVLLQRAGHSKIRTNQAYQHPNEEIHRIAAEAIAAVYAAFMPAPHSPHEEERPGA